MKTLFWKSIAFLIFTGLLLSTKSNAQFTKELGTPLDESFTKVIRSGTNYYVIGKSQFNLSTSNKASITRINSSGQHIWTVSLNISTEWTDGVLTPTGDLLVVGYTLPLDASSKSIMGLITSTGAFSWVKSYDVPGRDFFNRIIRSPIASNFPYYVVGGQNDPSNPSATWDDVILLNLNAAGAINWKRKFTSNADDEFFRDLEVLPNGELVIVGSQGNNGVILKLDANGILVNAATPENITFSYYDITKKSGVGYYAVGATFPNFTPYLIRYDDNFNPQWHVSISGLTAISQVWEDPATARTYVTATGVFNGKSRAVLIRFVEKTSPSIEWVRFLDNNEISYTGGSFWFMSPNQIAFTDGRLPASGGFGGVCALMHLDNMELNSCMTKNVALNIQTQSHSYNSPDIISAFVDIPRGTDILSSSLFWQQQDACPVPCSATFTFQSLTPCGNIQFTNQSTGQATLAYSWNFGDPGSGNSNTSSVLNPVHQYSACGSYKVCLKITAGNGCMDSICQTVTYQDLVKPILTCPKDLILPCNSSVNPANTGFATATDNCMTSSAIGISYSDLLSGSLSCNATFTRTWVATDACKNASSCVQIIKIKDTLPPIIKCPQNIGVQCTADTNPLTTGTATATDDCTISSAIIILGTDLLTGKLPCDATITRTFSAEDGCGNKSKCIQIITVRDNTPPAIKCPKDTSLQCPANTAPFITGTATSTDNCTPTASILINATELLAGTLPCNGTITRTWKATDECGNASTCKQIIKVKDTIAPTISCPRNPTVNTNPGVCYYTGTYPSATALDSCDPAPAIICSLLMGNSSILITPTTQYPKGINTITCYAIDACGNQSKNCTFTLTVEDPESPKIICPIGMTVLGTFDSLGRCKAVVKNIAPLVSDNCPMISVGFTLSGATIGQGVTDASGTNFMSGATTVHYTVIDMAGNKDSCSFEIKVICESNWACPCTNGPAGSQNLVTNGNFNSGNTGFTNDFIYFIPGNTTTIGHYSVVTNTQVPLANTQWACSDHTTGTGSFLICDGASSAGTVAWRQTIPGSDSGSFNLCFYANNLVTPFKNYDFPVLGVFINNVQFPTPVSSTTLPEIPDAWVPINVTWLGKLPATIEIRTLYNQSIGNDFALDDISFKQCSKINPDSCVCGSFYNLSAQLTPGAQNLSIQCGKTYTLDCPPGFQFGGNFNCKGNSCDSVAKVLWNINGPINGGGTVTANSGFSLPINASNFSLPGLYTLTLVGYCDGKPCPPCIIYFESKGCKGCCRDSLAFFNTVTNFQNNGALGDCQISMNGTGLDSCMQVTWIWGDGDSTGPLGNAIPVYHVYSGTGTYNVCYLIEEVDANGKVCWSKKKCDTVYVICDSCCHESLNIIANGSFVNQPAGNLTSTSFPWYAANLTPQISPGDSCSTPRTGQLWGNSAVGEVMGQIKPGLFKNGWTYRISFCAKYININNLPPYLAHGWFSLNAGNSTTTTNGPICTSCTLIGQSPVLNQNNVWVNVCLPDWTASTNFDRLLINFQNSSVTNNGDSVSWGRIDDICIQVVDSGCCKDSSTFASLVNQGFTVINSNCKVTVTAPQFDSCYLFATPPILDNSIVSQVITDPSGSWMFNFIQSGLHQVCVTVLDECNSKQMCTRFEVKCDTCYCGSFTNLSARLTGGAQNQPILCGDTIPLNCPNVFLLGGEFNCKGNDCDSITKVEWNINGPVSSGGSVGANPGFSLPLNAQSFSLAGFYTLTLVGYCDGKPCPPCKIYFKVNGCDSTWSCPCNNGSIGNPDLVTNGHFTLGNDGSFTNDFIYFSPGNFTTIGNYSVVNSAQVPQANTQWACNDHTTGTGMFLIVDGASSAGIVAWKQIIPGTESGSFNLCFYANNLVIPSKNYDDPVIGVFINGIQVIANTTIPESPDTWIPFNVNWVGQLPATIEISTLSSQVVGNDFALDDISFTQCATYTSIKCNCAGADHLSFGGYSSTITVACGNSAAIEIPCDADARPFYFHGNVKCKGDSCLGDKFNWNIKDSMGTNVLSGSDLIHVFNGNTGHFDILNLNPAVFTPGIIYTLTVSWYCGEKLCTCDVKFRVKACDCKCGKFTNVFLRPTPGAASIPVSCDGDAPPVPCPTAGQPFNITGQFQCVGETCPRSTQVNWILLDPLGNKVDSGIINSNPTWSINLNPHDFGKAGTYCLLLSGHCGSQICACKVKFTFKEACPCDDCTCGKFSEMFIRSGQGPSQSISCDTSYSSERYIYNSCEACNKVCPGVCFLEAGGDLCKCYLDHTRTSNGVKISCPPNGQDVVIAGQVKCQGPDCPKTTLMDWILLDPNGLQIASMNNVIATPNFTLHISPLLLTQTSDYTLQLISHCGMQQCTCEIKFQLEAPCPDKCECDKFSILSSVGHGPLFFKNCGDTIYVGEGLPLFFSTAFICKGVCPPYPPIVSWSLVGPAGFRPYGGNASAIPNLNLGINETTFTLPGVYTLTMIGHCGNKECICKITFITPAKCCQDKEIFSQNVMNAVSVSVDNTKCKVTVNINNLSNCDYIEKISWGNGKESAGPFNNGDMPMNTYTSSGIYIISFIAVETDPATGEYCFVKLCKDTVRINCGIIGNIIQTQNQSFGERVRVFPNPTTGKFIVDLAKPAARGTILRVVGLTGQVLMEKIADAGVKEQIVFANTLPQGMYFIQVFTDGKPTAVEKFVKQ